MLNESQLQTVRRRPPLQGEAGGKVDELLQRLAVRRVTARCIPCADGITAGGVPLPVSVQAVCSSTHAGEHFMRRVCALVRDEVPLTLSLEALGAGDQAIGRLEDFCALLRRTLVQENLGSESIGIALASPVMPLQMFLLVCTAVLGNGPRYTLLDKSQMQHHEERALQEEVDQNWSFLWRRRELRTPLVPAYAASVTTRCPLLNDEAATAVLPQVAIQAPVSSAWLPLELRLADFSDGRGRLDWEQLRHSLRACVDIGDRLLDHLAWPEAAQRVDACLNRRLAVLITGIGDMVIEYGADPSDLRTLQWADRLLLRVSRALWGRSRALARRAGVLPALTHADPTAGGNAMARKGDWQRRWREAVARSAVRHRNLLVVSPYAVLPAADHDVKDFIDLLPALHHADAFCFSDPVSHGCHDADEYAAFHRRAFAVFERRNAASLVAAGA